MHTLVKATDATIRHIAQNKTAANYITKEVSPGLSLATTQATDYYEKETTPYNRIYYVLEGSLTITVDNEKLELQNGDACYIGKDTVYEMQGTFKAIVVNQPAFGS